MTTAGADMFTCASDRQVEPVTDNPGEMERTSTPDAYVPEIGVHATTSKSHSLRSHSPTGPGMNESNNTSGSSSASDILIRSTVVDPPSQLMHKLTQLGASAISLSSISSSNSSVGGGTKKVKVKAKHLKEIKSPFEEEEERRLTLDPNVPPPLFPVEKTRKHVEIPIPVRDGKPIVHSKRPKQNVNEDPVNDNDKPDTEPQIQGSLSHNVDVQQETPSTESDENIQVEEEKIPVTVIRENPHGRTNCYSLQSSATTFLKQGTPVEGVAFTELQKPQGDIEISDFRLGGKQKLLRETFVKRPVQNVPVKKIVQPKFITKSMPRTEQDMRGQPTSSGALARQQLASGSMDPEATSISTAAAATAAAVAAAAPMLKAQSDLEAKMEAIMAKLSSLDEARQRAEQQQHVQHVKDLEKQVDELTQMRLKHLEDLQKQQLQLHAKLLENGGQTTSQSNSRAPPLTAAPALQTSTPNNLATIPESTKPGRLHGYTVMDEPRRYQPAATFHPRMDSSPIHVSKPTQTSPLDTPAPRKKPPTPLTSQTTTFQKPEGRGLLEEILSPSNNDAVRDIPTPIRVTRPAIDSSLDRSPEANARLSSDPTTAEKQANKLVNDLGQLKREMRTVLQGAQKLQTDTALRLQTAKLHEEAKTDVDRKDKAVIGPAPIDPYLTKPPAMSPITYQAPAKLPGLEESFLNAPVPVGCVVAATTLQKVQTSRGYLDTNLEVVAHARDNEELYSLIDRMTYDRDAAEKAHIRSEVDKMIHQMNNELQSELHMQDRLASKQAQYLPQKDQEVAKGTAKGKTKLGKKKIQAKINTGLRKKKLPEDEVEGKENKPAKENITGKKTQRAPFHMQDEQYLTRVYGKALYHPQRKTEKAGPYLRFQSTPVKPQGTRPKATQQVSAVKVKSSKTQTVPSPKKPKVLKDRPEYYFNPQQHMPTHGRSLAPVPGQLIPMAIPLGEPRIGTGLTQPIVISKSRPLDVSNVAIVDIKEPEEPKKPQLQVQVLPCVDIDTAPPTPLPSEPVQPAPSQPAEEEEENELIDGTGISLPGYRERQPTEYHGPAFPPKQPAPQVVAVPSSDVLASEIGRRDLLENSAIRWVEQELMARIISQMRPEDEDEIDVLRPASPVSEATPDSTIMEGIGNAGLQLFVDSGHPVSSDLVNALVREVIEERLAGMLGQHLAERQRPLSPPSPRQPMMEEPPREATPPPFAPRVRVPTPQVTPRASPVHTPTPPAVRSPLDTPDVTPEGSIILEPEPEPETESSVEIREQTPPPKVPIEIPQSPIGTPLATPPLTPPPKQPTPPPSPRDSPVEPKPITPEPEEIKTPSPKPWTYDELPIPEELPSEEKKVEPLPRPVNLTLDHDIEMVDVIQITPIIPKPRPAPEPELSPPSDTTSSSSPEPSSLTDTSDRDLSEGEWLLDRSEGQIMLGPRRVGADTLEVVYGGPKRGRGDDSVSSNGSTLHETEDLDKDTTQLEPPSEGEVLSKKIPVHRDPMLTLLARLNQQAGFVMPTQPRAHLQPRAQFSEADISAGEVSWGQRPSLTPAAEKVMYGQSREKKSVSEGELARQVEAGSPGEVEFSSGGRRDKAMRLSELESPKSGKSPRSKSSRSPRSPKSPKSPSQKVPSRVIQVGGRSESPGYIPTSSDRVIHVGGRQPSPTKGRVIQVGIREPHEQLVEETGMMGGTHTLSDLGTMTPDQMNMEALLQSGYLTQTYSQSEGGATGEQSLPEGMMTGGSMPGKLLVTLPSADENDEDNFDISMSQEQINESTISDVSEISAGNL
ncbi:protein TALPID3-like [Glandiceps talaboti]